MNKVYAGIASVGFLVLGSQAGCSSADPPTGSGGTTSVGATTSTGGSTVIPTGGTGTGGTGTSTAGTGTSGTGTATAGTGAGGTGTAGTGGGTAGTGTAGTAAGGTGSADLNCKGIKTMMACMPEGTSCPGQACGLADSGVRSCNCATTWACTACDYAASPFKDKPADLAACAGIEGDNITCNEADKGKVCQSAGGEVCACWTDAKGALVWDCDKPPSTWAAAM